MEKHAIEEYSYDRPIVISVIAILLILGGVLTLGTLLISLVALNEASSVSGASRFLYQGSIGFLGLLGVAAGVGIWLGKRWGWWLALFYFTYGITRNINAMISIEDITNQLGEPTQGVGTYYIKYAIRVIWNSLLLLYMCLETATSFFKTEDTNKWKALLISFGVCVFLFAIVTLLA